MIEVDLHEFTIVSFDQSWILTWVTLCHAFEVRTILWLLHAIQSSFVIAVLSCDWGDASITSLKFYAVMSFELAIQPWDLVNRELRFLLSSWALWIHNSIVRCGLSWAHCFLMSLNCTIVTQNIYHGFQVFYREIWVFMHSKPTMRLLSWGRFQCQHKYWSIDEQSLMTKWVVYGTNHHWIKKISALFLACLLVLLRLLALRTYEKLHTWLTSSIETPNQMCQLKVCYANIILPTLGSWGGNG